MEESEEDLTNNSMVSGAIGRVMKTLLSSRPKKLEQSISRLTSSSKSISLVTMEGSLRCLHKYITEAAVKNEELDQILVPMIEHTLKYKESKHNGQTIILINWILGDDLLFQFLAKNVADIVLRKQDRFITLGWCILVRCVIDYHTMMNKHPKNGIRENYNNLLKILLSCIPHISSVMCNGSTLQDEYELPTRLAVSAADCILSLCSALTKRITISEMSRDKPKSSTKALNRPITLVPAGTRGNEVKPSNISSHGLKSMEMELLLWDQSEYLIVLVQKLLAWSRKSRSLHAKGLEHVLKWLIDLKGRYDSEIDKTHVLILYSCWKHYGMLLHLEDDNLSQQFKELLDQYLSGIQYYTDSHNQEQTGDKDGGIETRKFFLNCLCLLLGRSNNKQFESTMSEYGLQVSRVLLSQLQDSDEDIIDGAVCIFKAVIFKIDQSSEGVIPDTSQLDDVLPLLLHLLDERDGTARAAVMLIAEYCSISTNNQCLHEVLKRVVCGEVIQRRNALDVISELILISSDSVNTISHAMRQEIANHLLECLDNDNFVIREKASDILPLLDSSLVLPALVRLIYSSNEKLQLSAYNAIVDVLKRNNQKFEVISMLLDSLTNLIPSPHHPEIAGNIAEGGATLDAEQVLSLVPEWSKTVLDWSFMIGPLIDKMFADPSNAIIVKFLSYISDHLAEAADVVLHRVLLHMRDQKVNDESFSSRDNTTYTCDGSAKVQCSLFDRLCPLLVIRLLPLRVFNDLNSSILYGQSLNPRMHEAISDDRDVNILDDDCIASHLLNRAFCKLEFEDVRKLAAELCGRIHPEVLYPIISSQLEHATESEDMLKIKACLFSLCTSLVVRREDSAVYPFMIKIRKTLEHILSWPSLNGDEVSKAQHGCIDCLALMICAELQAMKSFKYSTSNKNSFGGQSSGPGKASLDNSVLSYVISQLTQNQCKLDSSTKLYSDNHVFEASAPAPFRLCMANVLISACQKMNSGKKSFARKMIPCLLRTVEVIVEAEIRAACIQVMFSAVYHLKSAVLPYASNLLKLSLKSLKEESEKEKMAGAKLMASLMASDDTIVDSISSGIMESMSVLSSISSSDTSPELRQICKKLLVCITSA